MSDLIQAIGQWLQQLITFITDLPLHLFSLLLSGASTFINSIPAPAFFADAAGWVAGVPPLVAYFLGTLGIGTLVTILVVSFTVRFVIRRIFIIN